jgi:hypothetical protein
MASTGRLLTGVVAGLAAVLQAPATAQGPFGASEVQVVRRFDRNGDGRLDAVERRPAREWLSSGGGAGDAGPFGRGFGRFGGRGYAAPAPGRRLTPADVKAFTGQPLYETTILRTLFLQFEHEDWEDELAAFYNTDVEVPATVVADGQTYRDVGVHFRGASSFRGVPAGSKRSLNLSFDFVHADQRLRGYRTLNLLNANSDPTFVRTVLYSEIARQYIPAPKTNYVRVVINGEDWGVYVNAQQFNSDFTRDFFSTTRGARWKVPGSPRGQGGMEYLGEGPDAYRRIYEIKTRDDPKVWADLVRLFRVLHETPLDKLEAALEPVLDVDGVLRFLAVEVVLVNTDGYWTRASDYSIYQDPKGRFHVVPHDMNEGMMSGGGRGFGGFGGGGVSLDPLVAVDDPAKPLRSRLLAVPALRARYLGYVRDIAERWLDWNRIGPLARGYQAVIAEEIKLDTRKLYSFEAFQSGLADAPDSVKSFADRRRAFLLQGAGGGQAAAGGGRQ